MFSSYQLKNAGKLLEDNMNSILESYLIILKVIQMMTVLATKNKFSNCLKNINLISVKPAELSSVENPE